MSDLTVRTPGGQWLNICDSEWYVRNEDNTSWMRIDPLNDLRVRHGSNEYWLPVTCDGDNELCPPESIVNCWPGYTGIFDSAEFKTGGSTGYLICDCNGGGCKTYTGHSPAYNLVGGRFVSTAPINEGALAPELPLTLFGGEAQVSEMLVKAGNRSGAIDVSIHTLDPGVRVRIYHDCNLLADSNVNGQYFNVFFNSEPPETTEIDCEVKEVNNFITVRVDAPANSRWRIRLGEVNVVSTTNYQRPAPCFGTFAPNLQCFVDEDNNVIPGVARYEMIHQIPANGMVRIDTTVRGPDAVKITVFYNGGVLSQYTAFNTPQLTTTQSTFQFNFQAVGGDNFIVVRYEAPRQYNDWSYTIYCADQKGSRLNMMPLLPVPPDILCQPLSISLPAAYTAYGRGAPYNDLYFDLAGQPAGIITVEYIAPDPVQMLFYLGVYPNEVMIGGTPAMVNGHERIFFDYNPALGDRLHVKIAGPCCPDWSFTVGTPVAAPVLSIHDAEVQRAGTKGEIRMLCFDVVLANKTPKPVTFDWVATPITALESADGTCTIVEEVPQSPYCNIVATGVGRGGPYANNTNIGYPQALQVSSSLHDPNCAVGGQYYVLETDIEIPATGTYTLVGTADDNLDVYLDCVQIFAGPRFEDAWRYVHRANFQATAGWQTISAVYQNVPNCTVGWMKFVILDAGGNVVFATSPTAQAWRSKAGTISVEPPQIEPIVYTTDYNKSSGSGTIPACTDGIQICVPTCGTDIMGPDVTLQITVSNVKNAGVGDLIAIGTIKNGNYFDCNQNTNIAVLDGGPDQYVNRNARKMYVSKLAGNSGAQYVMDMDLNIPAAGQYTFYFFGLDVAELYVDCRQVARVANGVSAVKVNAPLNSGVRKMFINYYTNAAAGSRTGYAAVAIVDSLNRVIYSSNAADWRGRIVNAGTPPFCDQFPKDCAISGNTIELHVGGGASSGFTVGYGAQRVRSSLHSDAGQPSGATYTLQYRLNLPAGNYRLVWSADDIGWAYINCSQIGIKGLSWRDIQTNAFSITDGSQPTLISIVYDNAINDATWACWAILNEAGQAVSVSGAGLPNQASAAGNVLANRAGEALGETYDPGRYRYGGWMVHRGGSIWGTGLNYAWWSAETEINIPASGVYYMIGDADDQFEVFIGCKRVANGGSQFYLDAGVTKAHVRVYNLKAKDVCWFGFTLYDAAGGAVYVARAAGWKAKPADLDFSGLS